MAASMVTTVPSGASPALKLRDPSAAVTVADRQNRIRRGVTRRFHDVDYIVEIEIDGDNLTASCEERFEGTRWTSTFSSRFIEEITHRTGNFKSFGVFAQMLFDALLDTSQHEAVHDDATVTVDILTGRDLELLRHRNGGGGGVPQSTTRSLPDSEAKRYLILTYQASYDRVHYPLALARQEPGSDAAALLRTIKRLSRELKDVYRSNSRGSGAAVVENLANSIDSESAEPAPSSRRGPSRKLISRLEEENERLVRRCADLQQDLEGRGGRARAGQQGGEMRRLRESNSRLMVELKQLREAKMRQAQLHRSEVEKLRKELNSARGQERQLRAKVRSLESDLARQRTRAPSSAGSVRSVGRGASPVSPRMQLMSTRSRPSRSPSPPPPPSTATTRGRPHSAAPPRRPPSTTSSRSRGSVGSAPVRSRGSSRDYAVGYVSPYAQRPPSQRRPSPYRERDLRASPVRRLDTNTSFPRGPSPVRRRPSPMRRRDSSVGAPARAGPMLERPVPAGKEGGQKEGVLVGPAVSSTTKEVADIDARLMALQNFLRNTMKT